MRLRYLWLDVCFVSPVPVAKPVKTGSEATEPAAKLAAALRYAVLVLWLMLDIMALAAQPVPQLPQPFSAATRLLVVAPHPDDEVLGAGGLIQQVLHAGGQIQVVYMTSGDGFPEGVAGLWQLPQPTSLDYRAYGVLREGEATQALAVLGAPSRATRFLGFPDSGVYHLWSTYALNKGQNYVSPFTLRDRPSALAAVPADTAYNGADLTQALVAVLQQFQPTLVITSHPYDQHADHCATYYFVRQACASLPRQAAGHPPPLLFTFLIHYGGWPPEEGAHAGLPLQPPVPFPQSASAWLPLALSPAERRVKQQALTQYHSQMRVMGSYLLSFVRANELFAPALQDPLDVRQPLPCSRQEAHEPQTTPE